MLCLLYANAGYDGMVNEYFLPSSHAFAIKRVGHAVEKACNYASVGFRKICNDKPKVILDLMLALPLGEVFLYADGDVVLFGLTPEMLLEDMGDAEIVNHVSLPNYGRACTGFMGIRNTYYIRAFMRDWADKSRWDDEDYFNYVLKEDVEFQTHHRFLPSKYWNIGQAGLGYKTWEEKIALAPSLIPKDIVMFHANFTMGLQQKLQLLELVRKEVNEKSA